MSKPDSCNIGPVHINPKLEQMRHHRDTFILPMASRIMQGEAILRFRSVLEQEIESLNG